MYGLKIHRGVMCNDTEERWKFEEESTCRFKYNMKNLTNFDLSTWKFQKCLL